LELFYTFEIKLSDINLLWAILKNAIVNSFENMKLTRIINIKKQSILILLYFTIACNTHPKKYPSNITKVILHTDTTTKIDSIKNTDRLNCFDYSEAESFDLDKDAYTYIKYSQRDKKYLKGKKRLSANFVINKLFGGLDSINTENLWTGEVVDKVEISNYISSPIFYLIDTILNTNKFTGIVYEEIDNEGSIKYFSTISKKNRFISRISIACFVHCGSYTAEDGSRPPWYTGKGGCFLNDSTIEVNPDQGESIKYKLNKNGFIIEIKPDPLLDSNSKESIEKRLSNDPNNARLHLKYARVLVLSNKNESKKECEKALQINPKYADADYFYANSLIWDNKDTLNADLFYKKAIEIDSKNSFYHNSYADFLSEYLKDYINAKKQFQEAIKLDKNNAQYHFSYAHFLYEKLNSIDEARKEYFITIKLNSFLKNDDDDVNFKLKIMKKLKQPITNPQR